MNAIMAKEPQVIPLNSEYEFCYLMSPFRIFYSLDGSQRAPARTEFSDKAELPDYIADLSERFHNAFSLFTIQLKLLSPIDSNGGIPEARYIDVLIDDIPVQRGLVSAVPVDHSRFFPEDSRLNEDFVRSKAIKVVVHRDLIQGTATPIHELFHVFQYSYCPFNNMWFMEGLARWAQNLIQSRSEQVEVLPQSPQELLKLLERQHDAEYFWRRLLSFTRQPELFIRLFLECCLERSRKMNHRRPDPASEWTRTEKRSRRNNPEIFRALLLAIEGSEVDDHQEFENFCQLIRHYSVGDNLVEGDLVIHSVQELVAAQRIEEVTGNLTISIPDLVTLNGWQLLQKVGGTLSIESCSKLRSLEGFDGLSQVKNLQITQNPELRLIDAFPRLVRAQPEWPGFIKVMNNRKLESVAFLTGLRTTGSSLYLHHNNLISLQGLECLEETGASLSLSSNSLSELSALKCLSKVRGMLGLAFNKLETLSGLENLKSVSVARWNNEYRSLALQGNHKLRDWTALSQLRSDTGVLIINSEIPNDVVFPVKNDDHFYKQRIRLLNGGLILDTNLYIPTYKRGGKKRVLFDNAGWKNTLARLEDVEPFFCEFKDSDNVISMALRHDVEYIYGQFAPSQFFLNDKAELLKKSKALFRATDKSFLRDCVDKQRFYFKMAEVGLAQYIPEVYESIAEAKFPAILKKTKGGNGDGVYLISSPDDYVKADVDGVLTECIPGSEEFATNIIYYRGEVLFEKSYRRVFEQDIFILKAADSGPEDAIVEPVESPCSDILRQILQSFSDDLICCCFDYKMKDGVPKIFEINTRLGFTLARDQDNFMDALNIYFDLVETKEQESIRAV